MENKIMESNRKISISYKYAIILTLICSLVMGLLPIIGKDLRSGDETRVAGISAAMNIDHDYIVPKLNGDNFLEYPPLYYWCTAVSLKIFGNRDFAAKLPSVIFAAGCALLILFMASKLNYPAWAALVCSLFLSSSPQFFVNSHKCMVDIGLVFFFLLSIGAFFSYERSNSNTEKFLYLLLGAVGITGGILTKGPIGAVFPIAAIVVYRFVADWQIEHSFSWGENMLLSLFFLLGIAGAAWWYYLLYIRCGGDALYEVTIYQNFGRFSGKQGDHSQSVLFYLRNLPAMFQPYLIFVFAGLYLALRDCRKRVEAIFLCSSLLLPLLLLCMASGKRVVYLLPLSGVCALLCGYFFLYMPETTKRFLGKLRNKLPVFMQCRTRKHTTATIMLLLAILIGVNAIVNTVSRDKKYSLKTLFAECQKLEKAGYEIKLVSYQNERTPGACVFYLGRKIQPVKSKDMLPPAGEAWIVQSKKPIPGALRFGDRHYLQIGTAPEVAVSPKE